MWYYRNRRPAQADVCLPHIHSLRCNRHACSNLNGSGTFRMFLPRQTLHSRVTPWRDGRMSTVASVLVPGPPARLPSEFLVHDSDPVRMASRTFLSTQHGEQPVAQSRSKPSRQDLHRRHPRPRKFCQGHATTPKMLACTQGSITHPSLADHVVATPCVLNAGGGQQCQPRQRFRHTSKHTPHIHLVKSDGGSE